MADPPRLDYVSPLPPVRSGIADYSVDLLPHLDSRSDLRVVRLPGQPVAGPVEERWRPVGSERLGEAGRLPLYHMGNNQHHRAVHDLAMRHPGLLVLHDMVLHHFLLGRTLGSDDFDAYRRRLTEEHGWIGERAAVAVRWGAFGESLQFSLPAHRRLVRRQKGVLVHSEWARETLLEEEPDLAVRAVPMGIPLPERVEEERGAAFRRRRGIPDDAPLLGSFGFQTPMKRPEVAIRAMARPELAAAHLVIAGEPAPTLDLDAVIAEAGIGGRVHVTGFLDFDEFESAIAACDLCLNLRYPSAGETSAALLRVLALGRATVVSDFAQFAELPEEVAIRVPLGEGEVESLAAAASVGLAAPERLHHMGQAAREYVCREHEPSSAAEAIVGAATELVDRRPSAVRPVAVPPPTTIAWSRLPGAIEVEGYEGPWAGGERRRLAVRLTNHGPARWLAATSGTGGVVVQATLRDEDRRVLEERPWLPLRRDLEAGETAVFELEVRRPLGSVRLHVEPHVVGHRGFWALGGPWWESAI
ncbi:MAG: glycosyltransferase [Thermoanaerobaculia bacterium]|nr:glycosyltransferase [Thermoanaerobaculia bacterium]